MSNKDTLHTEVSSQQKTSHKVVPMLTGSYFNKPYSQLNQFIKPLQSNIEYGNLFDNEILSANTNLISKSIAELKSPSLPSTNFKSISTNSIEEVLFNTSVNVKVLTSQVAMHLSPEYRLKLFAQIDSLHTLDDWDPDDKPIQLSSFKTFLKTFVHIKPNRYPSLGLSYNGNILAAWVNNKDRLNIEFLPHDIVKWVFTKEFNGEVVRSTTQAPIELLLDGLAPYNPNDWFFK
jgi:hypothetical protein